MECIDASAILESKSSKRVKTPETMMNYRKVVPYGIKIRAEQFSYKNVSRELKHTLQHIYALIYNLPLGLNDILKQIRQDLFIMATMHSITK